MTKIYISEYRVVLILFALFHRFDLVSSHYIYILLKCLPRDFFSTSRGLGLGRIRGSIFRDFGTSRLWKVRKYWPYPGTCDGGALACALAGGADPEPLLVVVVAVWLVVSSVLQDVRTVRVGRKVQRVHGFWRT